MHPRAEQAFDEQAGKAIAMFVRGWIVVVVFLLLCLAPILVLVEASHPDHLSYMGRATGGYVRWAFRDMSGDAKSMGATKAEWDSIWSGK